MKSLDHESLEEQTRLVPRYVAGDLSRSERAEFEAWLVASPELAAEVEMERRLRRGIASAARRGWLRRNAPQRIPTSRRWHMGIAASLLLALTVGLATLLPPKDTPSGEVPRVASRAPARLGPPLTVRLNRMRGAAGTPDIALSRAGMPSELTIEPDVVTLTCANGAVELECEDGSVPQTPAYPEYELDLVNRRGSTLAWRSEPQEPVLRTQLSFTLHDTGRLDAGDYDVAVRGVSPDHEEVVARFWLQVR